MFEKAIDVILRCEGGDSDDPNDPGGKTRFGISAKSYPDVDIAKLTISGASQIYRTDYWSPNSCDEMPYWAALCVFDSAVNMGRGNAVKFLQQVAGVSLDGKIGPVTLRVIKHMEPEEGIAEFMSYRTQAYAKMRGWDRYGRGWVRRCFVVAMEAAKHHAG
jgi:lysozyme family protein